MMMAATQGGNCCLSILLLTATQLFMTAQAARDGHCPILGPVLPAPVNPSGSAALPPAVAAFRAYLDGLTASLNGSAVSVTVKSIHEDAPLFEYHHTPRSLDGRGVQTVDGDSVYRIASISKIFTVLAVLMLEGVSLDDKVTKYLPELRALNEQPEVKDELTLVDWDDITLGALASHLAGIPSDYFLDLANYETIPFEKFGWPSRSPDYLPGCSGLLGQPECTAQDFWNNFGKRPPVVAPFTTPVYSNTAFTILGFVVEKVSGKPFEDFTKEKILDPLGMNHTFATKPDDSLGVIPVDDLWWNATLGFGLPAGGYYSSTRDLIALSEGILAHKLLTPARTRRWLKPWTSTSSPGAMVGAPWEVYRSSNLTADRRLVEVYTKSGGLFSYNSLAALVPDYGLVSSVMVGGLQTEVSGRTVQFVQTEAVRRLLPALEAAGKEEAARAFTGRYHDGATNSTLVLSVGGSDLAPGLAVDALVVRGVDIIGSYSLLSPFPDLPAAPQLTRVRLYPTDLRTGSRFGWRAVFDVGRPEDLAAADALFPWEGATCLAWAGTDRQAYELQSMDYFVFGIETAGGRAVATYVELPSYRVRLARE